MIQNNLTAVKQTISDHVTLVAVSKTYPVSDILQAYNTGHKVFGENKVQELCSKYEQLPKDIEWHMIGHLQTNKVKYIAPFISLIHSVDSLKLLQAINKEGQKNQRIIDCLFEIHIASEESKFGLNENELLAILSDNTLKSLKNIRIRGLMGMASYTNNTELIRNEFKHLAGLFEKVRKNFFDNEPYFSILSMGMSGDYKLAIEEGANMIRIGTTIFGERNYSTN